MRDGPRASRRLLCLACAGGVPAILLFLWLILRPTPPPVPVEDPELTFPLPPSTESRFLNTGPDANWIGTAACAECHAGNHASYQLTAHSRALADLDPKAEPEDGAFDHAASGRSYRVYRQDGQLRHQEIMRTAEGKEVSRVDLPIRYLVGSGNFCRSYLVEVDGFLHESPITWYTARKKWGMSPGYDFPQHWSFERPTGVGCLECHAGRVEAVGDTVHRLNFPEKAIGCESCHGPGSLHRQHHRDGKREADKEDSTIVHPRRLDRPLQEAICAACHLSGAASVQVRGRRFADFRPGTPLGENRVHYRLTAEGERMTVVGHVEQLRLSACYQKSDELTCLTCHPPHRREKPKDLTAFHRQKCLDCHATKPCGLDEARRLKKEPADNCVACHMPRGDTEIPHIAFTHHRIGRHEVRPVAPHGAGELMPIEDVSHLSPVDRRRNLGLAYLQVARNPLYARYAAPFLERGIGLLEAVRDAGLEEGVTAHALAEAYWKIDPDRAAMYARMALDAKDTGAEGRATALLLLGDREKQLGDMRSAVGLLEKVVRVRRHAEDWRLLGVGYLETGRTDEALSALRHALAIRPSRPTTHLALEEAYGRRGDAARARDHAEKARWLLDHHRD